MNPFFLCRYVFEGPLSTTMSRWLRTIAELRVPECFLNPIIGAYISWFGVDMSQVSVPAEGFGSFGDFFARKLKPQARQFCCGPDAIVCPCDGVLEGVGQLDDVSGTLVIKNEKYHVNELISDSTFAHSLMGGHFCIIYLHPRDYHRIHAPMNATLREVKHIPGEKYPMAPWANQFSHGKLKKNERVVFEFENVLGGPRCMLIMVAAFGVGWIESAYLPKMFKTKEDNRKPNCVTKLQRGDEIGAFRLGSTVVLLWPKGFVQLNKSFVEGERVLAGQQIGQNQKVGR